MTISKPNKGRTATVIVASSTSLNKNQADYICDGVDDQVEINAAINSLPANGGRVLLLEGQFNCASSLNINASQVVLEGQGRNTILKLNNGANTSAIVATGTTTWIYGVEIKNLQIDGNGTNQTGTSHGIFFNKYVMLSHIHNVKILNALTDGINITATTVLTWFGE